VTRRDCPDTHHEQIQQLANHAALISSRRCDGNNFASAIVVEQYHGIGTVHMWNVIMLKTYWHGMQEILLKTIWGPSRHPHQPDA
jgi:hypothetical protein